MQIISWNVASVRARLPLILKLLNEKKPDFLFLQEIKATEETFPYDAFLNIGYHSFIAGQKGFNGVAILSRLSITNPLTQLPGFDDPYNQARFVQCEYKNTLFISVYVPNGNPPEKDPSDTTRLSYKIQWLNSLHKYISFLSAQKKNFVLAGDFNVIVHDSDVYNPEIYRNNALMLPVVRETFSKLTLLPITNTLRKLHKDPHIYSFWDFQYGSWQKNLGMLLDYIFVSENFSNNITFSGVYKEFRALEKTSDHAPVFCVLNV